MITPYSYHSDTIFKVMLSPQQYLLHVALYTFTNNKINIPAKQIGTDVRGKLLNSENFG